MIASSVARTLTPIVIFSLLLSAPLLVGCGNGSDNDDGPDAPNKPSASEARHLASRYLTLSYKGASLRSTHPLNDSLLALRAGRGGGGPVVLVDTFTVEPDSLSPADSAHTVRVHVPHALTVSKVWETSTPQTEQTFTLRIHDGEIAGAPRIVGWPALRRHILRVESGNGEAIVERLRTRWAKATEERTGV